MALIQFSRNRLGSVLKHVNARAFSKTGSTKGKDIKKSVFISQSNDIYTNLALEEWLYKNFDFRNHHVLLFTQNDPCVVIGRNQNPWSEINFSGLDNLTEKGVALARRSSSGTALYHDDGSLNLTFFTTRERYNSKYDMEIVSRSIFRQFECKVDIGTEQDLLLRNNKQVSSKAARIGRDNSYHNMSLMVKSNKINRNLALQKHDVNIKSTARQLSQSPNMMNLCEESPQVTTQSLMKAVGWEFLRTKALSVKDGGMDLAQKQKGFHMVNPTEKWFPGLKEIRDIYSSWDWCYGKTPKFDITQTFQVPRGLMDAGTGASAYLSVTMTVELGKISDITVYVPYGLNSFGFNGEAKVIHSLKGKNFSVQAFDDLEDSLGCLLDEKDRFVTDCLKQVMTSA